jgi:hypothetical protein
MTTCKTETVNDLSRCLDPLDMEATLIAVIEMSQPAGLSLVGTHIVDRNFRYGPSSAMPCAEPRRSDDAIVELVQRQGAWSTIVARQSSSSRLLAAGQ